MDVFVGMHIYIHMQRAHSLITDCVESRRALEGSVLSRIPLSPLRECVCALYPKPPSVLLPLLLLSVVVQEVCKGDDSLEDERSGRPSEVDGDRMLSDHH